MFLLALFSKLVQHPNSSTTLNPHLSPRDHYTGNLNYIFTFSNNRDSFIIQGKQTILPVFSLIRRFFFHPPSLSPLHIFRFSFVHYFRFISVIFNILIYCLNWINCALTHFLNITACFHLSSYLTPHSHRQTYLTICLHNVRFFMFARDLFFILNNYVFAFLNIICVDLVLINK